VCQTARAVARLQQGGGSRAWAASYPPGEEKHPLSSQWAWDPCRREFPPPRTRRWGVGAGPKGPSHTGPKEQLRMLAVDTALPELARRLEHESAPRQRGHRQPRQAPGARCPPTLPQRVANRRQHLPE
jgi:hypothetical protein